MLCSKCKCCVDSCDGFCKHCGNKIQDVQRDSCPKANTPREVLLFLLRQRPEVLTNHKLLRSLLNDYLSASNKRESNLLSLVQECGIASQLRNYERLSRPQLSGFVSVLEDEHSIEHSCALEAVLTWVYGLGIELDNASPNMPKKKETLLPQLFSAHAKASLRPSVFSSNDGLKNASRFQGKEDTSKVLRGDSQGPASPPSSLSTKPLNLKGAIVSRPLGFELAPGVVLELCWCPAGSFAMGSPEEELGRDQDEVLHSVTLSRGFWMGKYPVTQAQYEAVVGVNPSYSIGLNLPVDNVSWDEALAFCQKVRLPNNLDVPDDYFLTLPTEAQWEYACRAGSKTALNNGHNLKDKDGICPYLDCVGWYGGNSEGATHEVGQKQCNAWGLFDMHGNVWEWCRDWYASYPSDISDPLGPETGKDRVSRGGRWHSYPKYCRSAYRNSDIPARRSRNRGFRVVLAYRAQ